MLRSMSRLSGVALGLCLTLAISTNAALAAATHGALAPKPPLAAPPDEATAAHFRNMDHIVVVLMENQSFDNLVGRNRVDSSGNILEPDTPFITSLAETQGVATLYFGVTHPSLPNYLAAVAGDYFGVQDDNPSCYAQPAQSPCDTAPGLNLVDTLEGKGLTWTALMQSMPSAGFLGPRYPASGPTLYAQKHNPFVYFNSVAS